MFRPLPLLCCLCMMPIPFGCSRQPSEPARVTSDHTWSDEQEVVYQLREVIRYEDETARQRRQALRALALPVDTATPAESGVSAGIGEDQDQQQ